MEKTSISCFSSFIYLENLFCINRSYLIKDRRKRIFGNIISILIFSSVSSAFVIDAVNSDVNVNEKMFQGVLAIEFFILSYTARYRNVWSNVLNRFDEKLGAEKIFIDQLEGKVKKQTFVSIISIIIEMFGMYFLGGKVVDMFAYAVMYAARESETIFFALIIEGINLRLMGLNEDMPRAGSRVYRHVLIGSSQMSIEFTARILIIMGVVFFTSVVYSCAVLLNFNDQGVNLAVFLLWRELKSMYCVWYLCRASANNGSICQKLAFQLAKKLAFDPVFDKVKHPQVHSIARRWYTTVLQHKPSYVRGSVLSIRLNIPLHLVDASINYVLIVVQIYVAYK